MCLLKKYTIQFREDMIMVFWTYKLWNVSMSFLAYIPCTYVELKESMYCPLVLRLLVTRYSTCNILCDARSYLYLSMCSPWIPLCNKCTLWDFLACIMFHFTNSLSWPIAMGWCLLPSCGVLRTTASIFTKFGKWHLWGTEMVHFTSNHLY